MLTAAEFYKDLPTPHDSDEFTTDELTQMLALCLQHQVANQIGTVGRQITQRAIVKLNRKLLRKALS